MTKTSLLSLASLALVAACGGGGHDKGTVNTTSARTSVDQVGAVSTTMTAMNGGGAAAAVQSMTSAGQSIVTPAQAQRLIGLMSDHEKGAILNATGTADCTPTMCTFTSYGDTGFTINGTISRSGDAHTFDLTYDIISAGTTLHWEIDGTVTVTASLVDGNVHSHGVTMVEGGSAAGVNVTWDVTVDYNDIARDAQGCPTGGSVHAVTAYSVNGMTGFDVEGTATFGPACGDVH
jgi:hypothetical protein